MQSGLQQRPTSPNPKLRSILGFGLSSHPSGPAHPSPSTFSSSLRISSSPSATRTSFFHTLHENMAPDSPVEPSTPLTPVRINPQDGPWSVSVAENPHDQSSYSIYVKTPTHHLTLTRSTKEIADLHNKLHEAYPNEALPPLPELVLSPTKRRGSFLHTLSRLGTVKDKHAPKSPTSVATPTRESLDPFAEELPEVGNSHVGALPAYLTTLANHPTIRTARLWKRFVHVRVDDLESVRVERTIKRVRSDLAGHTSPTTLQSTPDSPPTPEPMPESKRVSILTNGSSLHEETIGEVDESVNLDEVPSSTSALSDDRDGLSSHMAPSTDQSLVLTTSTSESTSTDDTSVHHTSSKASTVSIDSESPPLSTSQSSSPTSPTHHHLYARGPRSASVNPESRKRLSNGPGTNRQSWKSSLNPAREEDDGGLDTEAEAGFDTDIEHPSEATDATAGEEEGTGLTPLRKTRRKKRPSKKVSIADFDMMRVLGKGCAGKVLLVKHKPSSSLYALKAITKRHVLAHQELQHTLTEQAVLKRMSRESQDPFVVKLWWSFHDKENLFLVMDFHPGGDLATQLARWGRLGRDRARFYAAEIVEGVEGLHAAGVIYRDLKPENILIGADGHIVLTDFGLSKEFPRPHNSSNPALGVTAPSTPNGGAAPVLPRWMANDHLDTWRASSKDYTSTFCGTAEYLAPEVIQGLPYSYEVDWWSFGTMLFEMLSGITPFWANNHSDMYVRVLQDELQFPEDKAMDQDTKSLIRGLLQRNPALRIREPRIKKHPYFSMIDWSHVYYKRYIPPYIPPIDPQNASDTQNFDDAFLDMSPTLEDEAEAVTDSEREKTETEDERTDDYASSAAQTPAGSIASSSKDADLGVEDDVDVFDGYSFKGRNSVLIDDEDEEEEESEDEKEEPVIETPSLVVEERAPSPGLADDASDVSIKAPVHRSPTPSAHQEPATAVEPIKPLRLSLSSITSAPFDVSLTVPLPPSPTTEEAPEVITIGFDDDQPPRDVILSIDDSAPPEVVTLVPEVAEEPSEPAESEISPTPTPATAAPSIRESVSMPTATPVEEAPAAPPARPISTIGALKPSTPAVAPHVAASATKGPSKPPRREKSGIPALDNFLSSEVDTGRDDEDDDWDMVETPGGEEINGPHKNKNNTLFSRGVVDRYRLAVFRKTSSSHRSPQASLPSRIPLDAHRTPLPQSGNASPSPSESKRRGRTPGLGLRKSTNKFFRAKSPSAALSPSPKLTPTRPPLPSSPSNGGSNLATPSPRSTVRSSARSHILAPPSLKSKSSGISRMSGSPGSSAASINNEEGGHPSLSQSASEIASTFPRPAKSPEDDKHSKNFKKMKVGAEKVLSSIFNPRQ